MQRVGAGRKHRRRLSFAASTVKTVKSSTKDADPSRAARLATYRAVSTELALHSDRRLRELLDTVPVARSGIGGDSFVLEIGGARVFVKKIPLADAERLPDNLLSTANLFGMPTFCQYGIGSPGFGVWRELAAHVMTTGWVLGDEYPGFPLMYHWRLLPGTVPSPPEALRDVEGVVAYWEGSPAVRERIEAIKSSSASIVLFLEYLPHTVAEWLPSQLALGGDAAESACALLEQDLVDGVSFMNDRGLLHFDAHFGNILTDGHRLYFADFGLALSARFELSAAETAFFAEHRTYDRAYAVTFLTNQLVTALYGLERTERDAFVSACAEGKEPEGIPNSAAAIIGRYATLAATMTTFYQELQHKSRKTPYPVEEIRRVIDATR